MTRCEVRLLLRPFELHQRRADVFLGCAGAVLLLVAHLKHDRPSRGDPSRKSIGRTRFWIDELVAKFAIRAVLIIVQQRLEVLLARVVGGQKRRHFYRLG